jgi:hypothetical protein
MEYSLFCGSIYGIDILYICIYFFNEHKINTKIVMENHPEEREQEQSVADKYRGDALNFYKSFDEALKIREGDNFAAKVLKLVARVFGITFFILISPFVMFGLFVAFIAAG